MKKRVKRSTFFHLFYRAIVVISAISIAISYLSVFINPSVFTAPLFFGLYFIPLVFLNLLLLIISLIKRSSTAWIPFIALLPAILLAELFIRWGDIEQGADGQELKICTYNVGLFVQGRDKMSSLDAITGIKEMVKKENPHILCFQEYLTKEISTLQEQFPQYPYLTYHLFTGRGGVQFGNVTLSQYPIVESGKITFKRSTNLCIWSDIEVDDRVLRVYNTHLESHSISFTALLKRVRENRKVSEEIYTLHDKVAVTFKRRSLQVDSLIKHIEATALPSIVCGDFNDTPISYTYRVLSRNRVDTFKESGKGFSSTYSLLWPLLRIDYILTPKEIWSAKLTTNRVNYSDHYPVIAHLIIP